MLSAFALETWATFAVAVPVMLVRFVARLYAPGWRHFDGTDLWCAISTVLYTIVTSCNYLISTPAWPTNIELNEKSAWEVPKENYAAIIRGSKVAHFSWTIYICMIFAFKGVMLSLLRKVSQGVKIQERAVFWITIAAILAWIASVLAHLLGCVPVQRVWQIVPYPGATCTTRPQNYIVTGSLNMLTDAAIIAVPMPMLWNLQVPLPQKLALGVLFSSGILVIFCTILRTYYFFGDSSNQFLGQLWSGREGFISMIIIATPGLWPLFRKMKWFGLRYKSSYGVSGGATGGQSHSLGGSRGISGPHGAERLGDETSGDDTFVMVANSGRNEVSRWRDNSEESIIRTSNSFRSDDQGQIRVTKEFTVKVDGLEQGRKN